MGKEVKLFKSEERLSRSEVTQMLRSIADKLDQGSIHLKSGQDDIQLEIPGNLILEIQVEEETKKSKGLQHSLEIELKWFEGDEGAEGAGGLELL